MGWLDLTDVEQYDCMEDEQVEIFRETFTCLSCGMVVDIDLMFMGCCIACRRIK